MANLFDDHGGTPCSSFMYHTYALDVGLLMLHATGACGKWTRHPPAHRMRFKVQALTFGAGDQITNPAINGQPIYPCTSTPRLK